jgi:outer membrane lipoprotein
MTWHLRFGVLGLLGLLLSACATAPVFETKGVDTTLTPSQAVGSIDTVRGKTVLWGGVIIASTNLERSSQIEVLSYPLDQSQEPDTSAKPLGRFLIVRNGYLETLDFAPGRLVTVVGPVTGTRVGQIGETGYVYPVVAGENLYLWPKQPAYSTQPQVRFGIGVGVFSH